MAQQLIVGMIVACAALYSLWAMMPAGVRRKASALLVRQAARIGATESTAQRLHAALSSKGGCSECSSCGGCSPGVPSATTAAVIAMPPRRGPAAR